MVECWLKVHGGEPPGVHSELIDRCVELLCADPALDG